MEADLAQNIHQFSFGKKFSLNFLLRDGFRMTCPTLYKVFTVFITVRSVFIAAFSNVVLINYMLIISIRTVFALRVSLQGCHCG